MILPANSCARGATTSASDSRIAIATRHAPGTTADAEPAVIAPVLGEMSPSMKEGASGVVVVPIVLERERHDRHVDLVDIVRKVDVSIAIEVVEKRGPDPPAIPMPGDVTPIAAAEAAMNVQVRAAWH